MKKSLIVLLCCILAVFLLSSCDDSTQGADNNDNIEIAANALPEGEIAVRSDQIIEISGIEDDEFVEIVPFSSSRVLIGPTETSFRSANPNILATDLGSYIPIPDENGVISILGSDIGITSEGFFRLFKLKKSTNGTLSMDDDAPTLVIGESEYYTAFFRIDLSGYTEEQKSRMVLVDSGMGSTGFYVSHSSDIGLMDSLYWGRRHTEGNGILNLSGRSYIDIYLSFSISGIDGYTLQDYRNNIDNLISHNVMFLPLTDLHVNDLIVPEGAFYAFGLKASDLDPNTDYAIEVIGCNRPNNGDTVVSLGQPRNADGTYRGYFLPYKVENGNTYIHLGKVTEDFFFGYFPEETPYNIRLIDAEYEMPEFELQSGDFAVQPRTYFAARLVSPSGSNRSVTVQFFWDSEYTEEIPLNDASAGAIKFHSSSKTDSGYSFGEQSVKGNSPNKTIKVGRKWNTCEFFVSNRIDAPVYIRVTTGTY